MDGADHQGGLSLVELMIALALSSFLILGITQVYLDSQRTNLFQQGQLQNQESRRLVSLFLQQELSKAGYRRSPATQDMDAAFGEASGGIVKGCSFAPGQAVQYVGRSAICIRYQPRDRSDRDCLGNRAPNVAELAEPYTGTHLVFVEKIYLGSSGDLRCASAQGDEALVDGLVDLVFQVAVASSTQPRALARHVSGAPGDGQTVVGVGYKTLLRSSGKQLRDAVGKATAVADWTLLTGAGAATVSGDAGQLYQVSQGTVMLRNLMP
ncbi:PilW family protein [Pseudomonas sp. SCB32]|uniref:PilW family protein n=1 Tax=Pseudomonas sp. SCB32 TaxID=2653853 RepID=UPI0012659E68|nr:prepilin-type N-terminal cleavage/methylation domain-containing protein [Pseudomonas sp. SCB32]